MNDPEFYVGYLPHPPAGIARHTRNVVVGLFLLVAIAALGFAAVQRTFAPSAFEYGKERTFEGVLETNPYPVLRVPRVGANVAQASSRYLLVAPGKHGADDLVANYRGKTVRLRGTLIYRDNQTMMELIPGSVSLINAELQAPEPFRELGTFALTGEIVDTKCNLGVMNPGSGKVHKDCAVRCLSGGIPAGFVTADFSGHPAVLLLTDSDGKPLSRNVLLTRVAQPVQIRGKVFQVGDTLLFETDPASISPLP